MDFREHLLAALTEPVEPMDLTAPAEVLIRVPWTTPTTNENAFARTLELADMRDAVVCRECRRPLAVGHGVGGWLCEDCANELHPRDEG